MGRAVSAVQCYALAVARAADGRLVGRIVLAEQAEIGICGVNGGVRSLCHVEAQVHRGGGLGGHFGKFVYGYFAQRALCAVFSKLVAHEGHARRRAQYPGIVGSEIARAGVKLAAILVRYLKEALAADGHIRNGIGRLKSALAKPCEYGIELHTLTHLAESHLGIGLGIPPVADAALLRVKNVREQGGLLLVTDGAHIGDVV